MINPKQKLEQAYQQQKSKVNKIVKSDWQEGQKRAELEMKRSNTTNAKPIPKDNYLDRISLNTLKQYFQQPKHIFLFIFIGIIILFLLYLFILGIS